VGRIRREVDKDILNSTWNVNASSSNSHCVELWNLWFRLWNSFHLMDLIIVSFKLLWDRNPTVDLWGSGGTSFGFEARKRNVREGEKQSHGWTWWWKWLWHLELLCSVSHHCIDLIPNIKVNRSSCPVCLGLSELLKLSWNYFGNT